MNSLLVLLWVISMLPLLLIPYSIAVFYHRSFRRNTYPYIFLVSFVLMATSLLVYAYQSFYQGMLLFAIGGILLGGASLRLDHVMTRRGK